MNPRIQTANYTRLTRSYLTDVIEPVIKELEASRTPIEHSFTVAGADLALRSFSPILSEHFARTFAHLPVPAGDAELTVYIWDSVGTDTSITPPWNTPRHHSQAIDMRHVSEDGFTGIYMHFDDTITLYDPLHKKAYFWMKDASLIPIWISAAPLRTLLQWVLGERDIHLIHGAIVGEPDKTVLLSAKGGSGKSTTSLACLRIGMSYLADDYGAIKRGNEPYAYSLYNSMKVAPYHGIDFDPAHVWNTEGQKSVVFLSPLFPKQIIASAPLKAIMIPRITHGETTTIVPATKAQAMLALLPTTLFQLPMAESDKMQLLSSIIAALPCYTVELGRDSLEAAGVIRKFIRENL